MTKFLFLSAALSVCAIATPFGACVPGSLVTHIGNACASSDRVFENFTYSRDVDPSSIHIDFQRAYIEFRHSLAPVTGAGFFTTLSFVDKITVQPGIASIIPANDDQILGVADQPDFVLPPSTPGQLSSSELVNIQATAEVAEPPLILLSGAGLLCLVLLRQRRAVPAREVIQHTPWKVK